MCVCECVCVCVCVRARVGVCGCACTWVQGVEDAACTGTNNAVLDMQILLQKYIVYVENWQGSH